MRILQVTNTYYPEVQFGGPPLKIHALSQGLVEEGHEVEVITFRSDEPRGRREEMQGRVRVQYVPWAGYGLRQYPRDLSLIRRAVESADLVQCYGLYNLLSPAAAYYAWRTDRPYLLELLGHYPVRVGAKTAKRIFNRLITSRMVRHAAAVVVSSPNEESETRDFVGRTPLVVRRNGIDLSPFAEMPSGQIARAKLGVREDTRVILFIGRITPVKNLLSLIAAFRTAALANAVLVLVGPALEPEYDRSLRTYVEEAKLGDRVIFAGALFKEEKLSVLKAADLFVLPSLNESFGNAAAEAVAAGVPVLITDQCGIAPMIDQRAGLMVPLSTKALAAGMRTMMDDAEERDRVTSRREEVVRELSWDAPIRQTEALYLDILARRTAQPTLATA